MKDTIGVWKAFNIADEEVRINNKEPSHRQ